MFLTELAIDLGTANTCVFARGKGLVLNEPSIVALNTRTSLLEAAGAEASRMVGRTPDNVRTVRPLHGGVIADHDAAEKMLVHFIKKAHQGSWARPRVVIGIPPAATQLERRAVRDSMHRAKARQVFLIEQPLAAAIGMGMPVSEPGGNMVVDVGGGTTDIAIISLNGVVVAQCLRVAGDAMNDAILDYMKKSHNLLIGEQTAERIKIEIGSAAPLDEPIEMEVKGRHQLRGVPRTVVVCDAEIRDALEPTLAIIMKSIKDALEKAPPEIAADIFESGIALTGGGSLLRNFDARLREETRLPVNNAEDPLGCVVQGAGKILGDADLLKRLSTN